MKFLLLILCLSTTTLNAQVAPNQVYSDFVLQQRRTDFDRHMKEKTINAAFALPLNSDTEEKYVEACWAISQFLLRSPQIEKGLRTLITKYPSLENETQRALLEAVYGVYPTIFKNEVRRLNSKETHPKLFAMQAVYQYRLDHSKPAVTLLRKQLQKRFPNYREDALLVQLDDYLQTHDQRVKRATPDIKKIFAYRKQSGQKTIYSFQRWNRDHPGLAIIQETDGSFARDSSGRLKVFQQLARSASDLPYFSTNGSTPQGIYSIQGTAVSRNALIGPTPNIQLVMPNEADSVFWHSVYDSLQTPIANYLNLLPQEWRNYVPVTESFYAGKIGRTEIIAHGTTIDPEYFKGKPFYPLTPTMGCLCARESWNSSNGKILQSDQLDLANTFLATPGSTGYLVVINLDNKQQRVNREEIEKIVSSFVAQ
jgi:hypothetical protein